MSKASVPYASATSGVAARTEITNILRRFGCSNVGFMDDYQNHEVLLAFEHRGNRVQLRASAKGWAAMFLKAEPWTPQRRSTRQQYEQAALDKGLIAVNSVLRDWVKGQITAVETGVLSFAGVFLPYMIAADGRPVLEHIQAAKLLAAPTEETP
ncbi:hypothetical protein [Devosia ginsengisoli]|uniref:Uncharacterized protein n=1 Tax=Devosia ginsengisoli TaxID=400770 RepID=A0A5B8LRL5_9HYPH|nr:hypothetical protein [Devosia ginsengisoli]QDZ10561.1 hypothetical protein FPZ08_07230 [Devosia ginsengisoli]